MGWVGLGHRKWTHGQLGDSGPQERNSLALLPRPSRERAEYTQGDSDVISMPGGFRRHLVGKTLIFFSL